MRSGRCRSIPLIDPGQHATRTTVQQSLRLDHRYAPWLDALESVGAPPYIVRLPDAQQAHRQLAELAVPDGPAAEALDALPSPAGDPEIWWLLERCQHRLVADTGGFTRVQAWPSLPLPLGAVGRYFYLYVFLAALPHVRSWHAANGVAPEISRLTLADAGKQVEIHGRTHGAGGMHTQDWLTWHFRCALYRLGRLQFNRSEIGYDAERLERAGAPFCHGDQALGTHIPEVGPLTPEACDASLRQARPFFEELFGGSTYRWATCNSWLLDDQLAEYLPAGSNIIRFQRRFHLLPGGTDGDQSVLEFVFRRPGADLSDLPQRTTLERAVVAHLRAGRHWVTRSGWLEL